jgi:hypothetical protein
MMMADFSIGLTRDALWLRTESWRRTFTGTAILCIASLLGLILIASLIVLVPEAGWRSLSSSLGEQFNRSLFAAPLIVFVAFASASSRHIDQGSQSKARFWMKQQTFFWAKVVQVLLLAFVLSVDICQPLHKSFPATADFFQIFCFVLFALIGLRWAIHDQEQRYKHCLHSLATQLASAVPRIICWSGMVRS